MRRSNLSVNCDGHVSPFARTGLAPTSAIWCLGGTNAKTRKRCDCPGRSARRNWLSRVDAGQRAGQLGAATGSVFGLVIIGPVVRGRESLAIGPPPFWNRAADKPSGTRATKRSWWRSLLITSGPFAKEATRRGNDDGKTKERKTLGTTKRRLVRGI